MAKPISTPSSSNVHSPRPLRKGNEQLHADVPAEPLGVGEAQEHQRRHGDLDDVDVAEDRRVEELPAEDLHHADQHQPEDPVARDQRGELLQRVHGPVDRTQRTAAVANCGVIMQCSLF